jgi:hypothetical protein
MDRLVALQAKFDHINAQAAALEGRIAALQGASGPAGENATVDRLRAELDSKGVPATFIRAPKQYYDETLEFRRDILGAPSVQHLCKSIIMENTRVDGEECLRNPSIAKYWLVIVQYASKGATKELLNKCVHAYHGGVLSRSKVNMRVVPEDVSVELSGFGKNAVSPVGMKSALPMILAKDIAELEPDVFWVGGGEVCLVLSCGWWCAGGARVVRWPCTPMSSRTAALMSLIALLAHAFASLPFACQVDLKLGMKVSDFVATYKPIVAPLY